MPDFLPFRGLRYQGRDLSRVTAPPYDVIDDDERDALERSDPRNAVRLILPRDDAPTDRYACAAAALERWRADGTLFVDAEPAFYEYRMFFEADNGEATITVGVIGALGLPAEPGAGDILPHERTMPKARSDRLAILQSTRANLDPIWGVSLGEGLTEFLHGIDASAPEAVAIDGDGTRHELSLIVRPEHVREIRSLIEGAPIVIADGHHRFETACKYRDEQPDDPAARAIMALVVPLAEERLAVHPIHRLISGITDLRARLEPSVHRRAGRPQRAGRGSGARVALAAKDVLGFVDAAGIAVLRPREEVVEPVLAELPEALRRVDSAMFDVCIRPLLGEAMVSFRADTTAVAALVDKGAADAAVLLRPCSVDSIRAAAFAGERMPEKTTFFAPKPRTGMVFRSLDDA